jgi:hypothetical protein
MVISKNSKKNYPNLKPELNFNATQGEFGKSPFWAPFVQYCCSIIKRSTKILIFIEKF